MCQNDQMHKFLAIFLGVFIAMPAFSAGLGFNPFDRQSPTSPTAAPKPGPTSPAANTSPAPKAIPSPAPASPIKQDVQSPAKNSPQQNKK
jgi:hypothetical protein